MHLLARLGHVYGMRTRIGRVLILHTVIPRSESRFRCILMAPEITRRVVYIRQVRRADVSEARAINRPQD